MLGRVLPKIPKAVRRIVTFLLALIGWVIFRVENLSALGRCLAGLFSFDFSGTGAFFLSSSNALSPLLLLPVALLGCLPWKHRLEKRFGHSAAFGALKLVFAFLLWIASVAMLLGESYNPFIYFRF